MGMYRKEWNCCGSVTETDAWEPDECPFCTAPPPRQPLTDEREAVAEIARLHDVIKNLKYDLEFLTQQSVKPLTDDDKWKLWIDARSNVLQFARAIEAAHGIKE